MKRCIRCDQVKDGIYFTPYKESKDGLYTYCKECNSALARARYARKMDKSDHRAHVSKWRNENIERARAIERASNERNREMRNLAAREYRAKNLERARKCGRQWAKNNPDKANRINSDRRAKKKSAIPNWSDSEFERFFVKEAYDLARLRTVVTESPWHVDHAVSLRNKMVCGLHCAANFQVITAVENHIKGNRVWPDMWT